MGGGWGWGGALLPEKFMGEECFTWGLKQIMPEGKKSFTNEFSSNSNSVNLKAFSGDSGRHT